MRPVVLIGTGRLAHTLAYLLHEKGLSFRVYGRRKAAARQLARPYGAPHGCVDEAPSLAYGFYLLAVSDGAIRDVSRRVVDRLAPGGSYYFIHFSGAFSSRIISTSATCRIGRAKVHPMVSFPQTGILAPAILARTHCGIEGDPLMQRMLTRLLTRHFGLRAFAVAEKDAPVLHLICVVMANFISPVLQQGLNLLHAHTWDNPIGMDSFHALIASVLENMYTAGKVQPTGPLARLDIATIEQHARILKHTAYGAFYRNMALLYLDVFSKEISGHNKQEIERLKHLLAAL